MRGLDPRIHPRIELRFRAMDCRIKPGNDAHAAHRNSYSTVKQQASRASQHRVRFIPELGRRGADSRHRQAHRREFVYTNPNVAGGRGSASNSYRRVK